MGRTDDSTDGTDGTDSTDGNDGTDGDDGTDDTDADAAGGTGRSRNSRRRRRRGGRGADKASDGTATTTDGTDSDPDAGGSDSAPDDEGSSDGDRGSRRSTDSADGPDSADRADRADSADTSGEDDDDSDDEGGRSASSRRRRRRRRGGSDDAGRPDDPADTVVHVRETRSAESQVQGVRGSTRLEAKRQRRRDSLQTRRRPQILTEAEFLARRESVHRVMAVRQRGDLTQVAVLEDNVLVEHFVSRAGSASMIGNVFLGRVQNVLPSMEAAFVDIGRGRNAVLYAGEVNWEAAGLAGKSRKIETALSSGDTVLVQVSKDPVGHKGARLTTQISLPGRFLVYVPGGGATGISRKLPDTERRRLKAILDRIVPQDAGVIIRTAAEGVSEEELARDVERLKTQWEQISAQAEKLSGSGAAKLLYSEPDTLIKVIRDLFNSDISELIIDGDGRSEVGDVWESLSMYIEQVAPELAPRVQRFTGATDVFAAHRIDEQIAKALERKVYLPSGGSLVIDRTEAMTVIDVNTGKYTGSGGNLEETVTKNNLEAAEEVVRQLRLRDIGGIIVVDFIDMVLESNRELVLRRLTECLGRDRTRHQVAEVTSLGLIQMTRKKMGTGLVEAFSEPCDHCHGRGIVLRDAPVDPGLSEMIEAVPDRSAGRRNRGRGRDTEPVSVVAASVAAAAQSAPALRRDPRGPKPPEAGFGHGTNGASELPSGDHDPATGSEAATGGLAHELITELSGLRPAEEGASSRNENPGDAEGADPGDLDVDALAALLPAPDAGEVRPDGGARRRRRGGRGRSRRDRADDESPVDTDESLVDTDESSVDTDESPVDTDESPVDPDESLDPDESVDSDSDSDSDEASVDTDESAAKSDEGMAASTEGAEHEAGHDLVEHPSVEHPPVEPVDSGAPAGEQEEQSPDVAVITAPPRRRRAGRPAGPPQPIS